MKAYLLVGYYCKSGMLIKCPPGFLCSLPGLPFPEKCPSDPNMNSTCARPGLQARDDCPPGALCKVTYSLPIKAPPSHYLQRFIDPTKNEMKKCDLGDYCPFGAEIKVGEVKQDQLKCPKYHACANSSVLFPTAW